MIVKRFIIFLTFIIFFTSISTYGEEGEPILYIIISFNADCNSAEYTWEQAEKLIMESHMKILEIIEKYPDVKIHFSPTGFTADLYGVFFPIAKNRWQKAIEEKRVSISTISYSNPLYTMNPQEDIVRNVVKGIACVKSIWKPVVENFGYIDKNEFDLTIPKKLDDGGIIYSIIPRIHILTSEEKLAENLEKVWYNKGVVTINGADGGQLTCLLSEGTESLTNIVKGNWKKEIDKINQIKEINKKRGGGILLMYLANAEFLYSPNGPVEENIKGFETFIIELKKLSFLKFTTPEEYFTLQKPEGQYTIDYGMDYTHWTKDESDHYINEKIVQNRRKLLNIKKQIQLAELRKRNISETKILYEEAWTHMMLSQTSNALGLNPSNEKIEYGKLQTDITELIITDCAGLLDETKKLEKTDVKEWRFAVGEIPGKSNPVWPSVNISNWEKVVFPHSTKIKEVITRDWVKSKNIENFPGFFPETQTTDWNWYRTDNLKIPKDYFGRPIYLIFDGLAGNALICVNGFYQYTASHQESDEPSEYSPNEPNEYGKFAIYISNLINPPDKENIVAIKIKNVSGMAGIYGKIYIGCVK